MPLAMTQNIDGEKNQYMNDITHSGFVAIVGRPNVGKSTLLNRFIGEKLVITSPKPQTTRNRITGIINRGRAQLVFFDTPGVHASGKLFNQYMTKKALSTLAEVEAVLFMVDSTKGVTEAEKIIAEKLAEVDAKKFLIVNKVDSGPRRAVDFKVLGDFDGVYEISALKGDGVEGLLSLLAAAMPEGPVYYPDDAITDRPERFIAQEYIREKVFELTGEELPYSVAVTVESWEDKPSKNVSVVYATIHVERNSQKAIIIGKGGQMIKEIGKRARKDLQELLGTKVFLDLHVGVEHNWTKSPHQLKRFGYDDGDR